MASFFNNPHEILNETIDLTCNDIEDRILDVIGKIVHKDMNEFNYKVQHLSGGNTNILYRVFSEDNNQDQYVIRLYGIGTEDFIDRSVENLIFSELSKAGISPPFVGLFTNGRVEGYLNARSLSPDEFSYPPIARSIARSLAGFHLTAIDIDRSVGLWNKVHIFFRLAQGNIDANKVPNYASCGIDFPKIKEESIWLQSTLENMREYLSSNTEISSNTMKGKLFGYENVLCHNDVLSGNVLLQGDIDNPNITLIDYEYSGYNYRAFDIANHFCEYAGFEFDIRGKFPSKAVRREFLRQFILHTHELFTQNENRSFDVPIENDECFEEFLEGLDNIVMKFVLVSHLYWGSWAVIQAAHSLIDFDFLEYAGKRFDGYYYHKEQIGL